VGVEGVLEALDERADAGVVGHRILAGGKPVVVDESTT
jgi:hypothetical protein